MSQESMITPYEIRDAISLPVKGSRVVARARRASAYPLFVTSSSDEAVAKLRELLGDAAVGVITDETLDALYGEQPTTRPGSIERTNRRLPARIRRTFSIAATIESDPTGTVIADDVGTRKMREALTASGVGDGLAPEARGT